MAKKPILGDYHLATDPFFSIDEFSLMKPGDTSNPSNASNTSNPDNRRKARNTNNTRKTSKHSNTRKTDKPSKPSIADEEVRETRSLKIFPSLWDTVKDIAYWRRIKIQVVVEEALRRYIDATPDDYKRHVQRE